MRQEVRAKFRCMSVTKKWDGSSIVEFAAVLQQGKNPENAEFWKFTPSGDATLNFRGPIRDDRGEEYKPGDYYYIDMHKSDEGGWCLSTVTSHGKENGSVELCTNNKKTVGWGEEGFTYGKLTMGIDNPPAFLAFDEAGAAWDVQFKWAEKSDD